MKEAKLRLRRVNIPLVALLHILCIALVSSCKSVNKPYNYKRFPDSYVEIQRDYESYYHLGDCQRGETIASIGAGNGTKEIQISCFVKDINWYLQEIDSTRLYQFEEVLAYHENLIGLSISSDFNLVLGTESSTGLPHEVFDRVLMLNVFHEIELREGIMTEIHQLLNKDGVLVIMERMGDKVGEITGIVSILNLRRRAFCRKWTATDIL